MRAFTERLDVRVSVVYGVIATLWVVFSDTLVGYFFNGNTITAANISLLKALGFVALTTLGLFAVLHAQLQKRAHIEQALLKSEESYRRVVNEQHDLICRYQSDFTLTFVNRAYGDLYGKRPEELIGKNIFDLILPTEREKSRAIISQLSATKPSVTAEHPSVRADGSICWIEWTDSALVNQDGVIIEYQAIGRDITERRRVEKAVQRQRQLADALRESLVALTSSLAVDEVMERILHYAATVVPCDAGSIILFEDNEAHVAYLRGFTSDAEASLKNLRLSMDAPKYKPVHEKKEPYCINDTTLTPEWVSFPQTAWIRSSIGIPIEIRGAIIGLLAADSASPNHFQESDVQNLQAFAHYASLALENAYHVSQLEQKVGERTTELNNAKERVEAILNNDPDGILLVNADLRIDQTNFAFNTLMRCAADDYFNQPLLEFVAKDDTYRVAAIIQSVVVDRKGHQVETRVHRKDGTIFDAEIRIGYIKAANRMQGGLVCTLQDITERKQAEQILKAKMEEEGELLRYLRELHNISIELASIDQLDEFYRQVVQLGLERLRFERLGLLLYDAKKDLAIGTYGTDEQGKLVDERHLKVEPGALTAILRRSLERTEHVSFDGTADLYDNLKFIGTGWNAVAVLWNGTESLGWLCADNAIHHQPASKPLLEILALYGLTISTLLARKRAEAGLQKYAHEVYDLYNNAPCGYHSLDKDGFIVQINDTELEWLGYTSEDVVGKIRFYDLLTPENQPFFQDNFEIFKERGWIKDVEYDLTRKDGSIITILLNATAITDENGQFVMSRSTVFDITELKQTQNALGEERNMLRTLIDTTPDFIYIKDRQHRFMLSNIAHALARDNSKPDDLIGKTDFDYFPAQIAEEFSAEEDHIFATGKPLLDHEQVSMGQGGRMIWALSNKVPLRNLDNQIIGLVGFTRDITGRKQAEDTLRQTLEHEKELGELKSRLVSMASHEFRTPLATILATSETLMAYRGKLDEAAIDQKLNRIQEQVQHLKLVIENVLQLSRLQTGRAEFKAVEVDLDALCQDIVDEFQNRPDVTHRLQYTCTSPMPPLKLDKMLMRQIISNLVSNAIKYSPGKSHVFMNLQHSDQEIILQVRDEGIGIPEADLKHLFQPFHRATNVGTIPGTGLGLNIAQQAIELHGGTVKIESELGVGTLIELRIPITSRQD